MRSRSSVLRLAACLVACTLVPACGQDDAPAELLPITVPTSKPQGEFVSLWYSAWRGWRYTARVEHELKFLQGGSPARPGGKEVWELELTVDDTNRATVRLKIDGEAKRPATLVSEGEAGDTWRPDPPDRTSATQRLFTDGTLAGLGGVRPWLPDAPVRVGETWSTPGLFASDPRARGAALGHVKAPALDEQVHIQLVRVHPDLSWDVRVTARLEMSGEASDARRDVRANVRVVDRITGFARIDVSDGQPRAFSLHIERIEEENGTRVRHIERTIKGGVQRVDRKGDEPK